MKSNSVNGLTALAISLLTALCAVSFVSCSDKIYEELNTDYTKSDSIEPSMQLTYAALQLYGDMNYVDVHRLYTYAFTQHLMGCWNTTNYGGQHRMDDNEMSRPWNNLYVGAFRNLTDGIERTKNVSSQANINAAMRILRVYIGALLSDYYGDVPFSQAGMAYINGNSKPAYDKQEDLYPFFIKELKAAAAQFDVKANAIVSDPIFEGNTAAWQTFAHSLRLRYAMRMSKVLPDSAKVWFEEAYQDGPMASNADDARVRHLKVRYSFGQESYKDFRGNALSKYFYGNDPANNPTYICQTFWEQLYDNKDPRTTRICRFFIDDYMTISTGDGRIDMTDSLMATQAAYPDRKIIYEIAPGEFSWDNWPTYPSDLKESPMAHQVAEVQALHPGYDPDDNSRWLKPKLAGNFLRSENPGILMTYAEVCFLSAEAKEYGWTIPGTADQYYKDGIRESMSVLSRYYDCKPITESEYTAYLTQPKIVYGAGDKIEQINTQAWILHFHNPAEAWANVRRSNYPKLTPPKPNGKNPIIDGKEIPVRLCYPLKEETYNLEAYEQAKQRVIATHGAYTWQKPLWWDK